MEIKIVTEIGYKQATISNKGETVTIKYRFDLPETTSMVASMLMILAKAIMAEDGLNHDFNYDSK